MWLTKWFKGMFQLGQKLSVKSKRTLLRKHQGVPDACLTCNDHVIPEVTGTLSKNFHVATGDEATVQVNRATAYPTIFYMKHHSQILKNERVFYIEHCWVNSSIMGKETKLLQNRQESKEASGREREQVGNMPRGVGRQPTSGGNVLLSMVVGRVEKGKRQDTETIML